MPQEIRDRLNFGRAVDRAGMPKDVADAALFLGSSMSDWMNGVVLDVNGGILMR
jgi:3-oxoacyl-[acyl-carrier protein] reductase